MSNLFVRSAEEPDVDAGGPSWGIEVPALFGGA